MRTIVIDDDHSTATAINRVLQDEFGHEVYASAHDLQTGRKLIDESNPDLVFLDIGLPDGKGYELINADSTFKVIFITAFSNYALKAFELAALDYILKPLDPKRIEEAYHRFQDSQHSSGWQQKFSVFRENAQTETKSRRIAIRSTDGFKFLRIQDILYCESDGNYTKIVERGGDSILTSRTLRSIEKLLSSQGFFRCHQSYLINVEGISSYKSQKSEIELIGGHLVTLARSKKREFLELVDAFQ